jgi:hypothetical protein
MKPKNTFNKLTVVHKLQIQNFSNSGSVEGGLRQYVGAVSTDGGDYIDKVMTEYHRILGVAGKPIPARAPQTAQPQAVPVQVNGSETEARLVAVDTPSRS